MNKFLKIFVIALIFSTGIYSQVKAYDSFTSMIEETLMQQYKTCFKKTFSTLNQTLMMSEAINGKTYTDFNDVWNLGIKEQLANPKDIPNGIMLADLTYVTYLKTGKPCIKAPNENQVSKNSACAVLIIDTNREKGPNQLSTTQKINDRFQVLLYSNKVLTIPNSVEAKLINEYKQRRYTNY